MKWPFWRKVDAQQEREQSRYRLRLPVETLIAQGAIPDRVGLSHEVASIVRSVKMLALEAEARQAPPLGIAFAAVCVTSAIESWKCQWVDDLSTDQMGRLYVLYRLLVGPPEEVERRRAQMADPKLALSLRDIKLEHDRAHAVFKEQRAAYLKAVERWEIEGRIARYFEAQDLVGFLKDMARPDRDLWHDIAMGAESGYRVDQQALYWIAAQAECDRASIAAFQGRFASGGHLHAVVETELRCGSTEFADQIGQIIGRWNAGFYTRQDFAFEMRHAAEVQQSFADSNDRIAAMLKRPVWPEPRGLFQDFAGRKTAASYSFAYNQGLYVLPPKWSDYVTG